MRRQKEVRDQVLGRADAYLEVVPERLNAKDPAPLKVKEVWAEARYDGKWVLRTNLDLPAEQIALKYKQFWMVEDIFRTMRSIFDTRPIYHKCTEAIRGHVFCSFLALCLRKELAERLAAAGSNLEWSDMVRGLVELQEMHTVFSGKPSILRSQLKGCVHKVLQAGRRRGPAYGQGSTIAVAAG